jgi:hypothetical protein
VQPELGKTSSLQILIDSEGRAQGYLLLPPQRWNRELGIWSFDVIPGANLQALLPPLLRALKAYGDQLPTAKPDTEAFSTMSFYLGRSHPIYEVMGKLAVATEVPYAWYVRVPDLPAFLKHIAPVLERRLADSEVAGYTGELKIDFYHGGLRIAIEKGQLTAVENWVIPPSTPVQEQASRLLYSCSLCLVIAL